MNIESVTLDPSTENSVSSDFGRQVADSYYDTTAGRGHSPSVEYYENGALSLKLKLEQWMPRSREAKCLDLACGCGEFLYLLESMGFKNTTGVDLCKEELDEARRYVKGALTKADVLDYLKAAESHSYDLVTALNLLEHLSKDNLVAVLKECRRVLRPGGTLVAMVPNAVSPFGSLTRHWDITHEWAFTTNNFRQLASLVGFDSRIEFRECGPRAHGLVSAGRYLLWQLIRGAISAWFLIELGTTKDGIYTMDMLVRMRKPE
jgi:2-polyprenyl-3-methyl-5-hydroxy-6-metoxy-1,4-benzoquinol methylase